MSRIVAINGSPKKNGSMSGILIRELEMMSGAKFDIFYAIDLLKEKNYESIYRTDIIIIVFPLYVDALPSHLVQLLADLRDVWRTPSHKPQLYAICGCGLYEGRHTETALNIMHNFADRSGLSWGYGMGIGGGGYIQAANGVPAKGITKHIHAALLNLANSIKKMEKQSAKDILVKIRMPRLLYILMANYGWYRSAKSNGLKLRKLREGVVKQQTAVKKSVHK